jgi:cation transport regulator ChaC
VNRLAVFAYGSLVSRESAAETLGRSVEAPIPARLEGFARGWILCRDNLTTEKTFARADGSVPRYCLAVGIEPDADAPAPNGALLELSETELDRLDLREMRFERLDVTAAIEVGETGDAAPPFDRVVAYRPRPENHRPEPPADAIIVANYLATVEAAFDELGPGQLDLFRTTTAPPPVEIAEATLVRDRIPEGNPRGW